MGRVALETPRLGLAPLTLEHTDLVVELDSDPLVLQHVFGRALTRAEVLDTWLAKRNRPDADARGLGYWAGYDGGEFLGWWCLGIDDADPTAAELGYRLRRSAWGRGYATEGSLALLEHAFTTVGLARVWAETRPANAASQRVLDKCGLVVVRRTADELGYEITREAWLAAAGR